MKPTCRYIAAVLLSASVFMVNAKEGSAPYNSPVQLMQNKGQVTDQHGVVRKDIDVKVEANGVVLFVGDGELHYQWVAAQSQNSKVKTQKNLSDASGHPPSPFGDTPFKGGNNGDSPFEGGKGDIEMYRMDVKLIGANKNAEVIFEEPTGYYENYYQAHTGEDGVSAKGYGRVVYKDIYPNIDLVFYTARVSAASAPPPSAKLTPPPAGDRIGKVSTLGGDLEGAYSRSIKYDFIVHPGGNPADIQLKYEGATELKLVDGSVVATTSYGCITEAAPYSYSKETGEEISSAYRLSGNTLSFDVGNYTGTLVVDPTLHWATYYGGSGGDRCHSVSTDSSDYVYVIGYTESANNIATTGAYQSTLSDDYNGFLAKFDTDGRRIWATYYSNGSHTYFANVVCNNGFIYVAGRCDSSSNLTSGVQQQTYGGGTSDGLLVKFNTSGSLLWATYYGGAGNDGINTVVADASGNIVVAGSTNSTNNIVTTGAYISTLPSTIQSYFFARFTSNGTRIWGTYMGKVNFTWLDDIATDKWNNIYIVGRTFDTATIATTGTHKFTHSGTQYDAYMMKFNSSGNKIWGTYYGGLGSDFFYGVTCDGAGNIYTVGSSTSLDSIATVGAYQTTIGVGNSSYSNGILVKFDSAGNRKWGTYYGGVLSDVLHDVLYTGNGKIWVTGNGASSGLATSDGYFTTRPGGVDILLAQFDTAGSRLWASYYGGSGYDYAYHNHAIAYTSNNDLLMAGYTRSTSGMSTFNGHQYYFGGSIEDGFLAKFTGDTLVSINKLLPDTVCAGTSLYVAYRTTYPFKNNNTFIVQLSDSTGSFSNPVNLGSKSGTATDSVLCTIPANTLPGTGYKIRIVGTQKADTSVESLKDITITNIYPSNLSATANSPVCPYDTLKLFGASTTNGVVYTWSGPGNFSSSNANPVIDSAGATGTGAYILNATYRACTARDTVHVTLKPLPYTGPMSVQVAPACAGDTLHLNAGNGATGTSYNWTGPNSFSASTRLAYIDSFSSAHLGTYILTANLNGCIQTDSASVTQVKPLPPKPTVSSNTPVCAGSILQLSISTTLPNPTFAWMGPNGFNSTSSAPTISSALPLNSGMYIGGVVLNGCASYDTVNVAVNTIPAKPSLSSNSPVCAGDSLHLHATSDTAGVSFSWVGPGSFTCSSDDTSFIANTAFSGLYTLTVAKNGCSNADTISINVKPLPSAVSISNNGPVCAGDTLQILSGTSTTGTTYAWTGPGGYSASNEDTSLANATPAQTGWYKLSLSMNGCTRKDSTYAVVTPIPVIHSTTYNNPLCVGESLNLSTGNIAGASYTWWGAANFTSNIRNAVKNNIQFTDTGWYYVSASVNTCTSQTDSIRVTINPLPFVAIAASPGGTICSGEPVQFTAYANNHGGTPAYQWYVNGVTTGVTTSIFNSSTLNNGDMVRCDMTEHTKCSVPYTDASNDITMTVSPWLAPSVSITADAGPSLFPNEPINFTATVMDAGSAPKYQWRRNGVNVQGATGAVWGANANFLSDGDEICVLVTSSYACPSPDTALSNCIKLEIRVGVKEIVNNKNIKIYPNPVKGSVTISSTERIEKVEILNLLGQKLLTKYNNGTSLQIDMSGLVSGVYIIKVNDSYISRLVKK